MAGFTLGELKRRRERLEERLDYLRKRVDEEGGQIPGRHCYKSAEASALQTALVLFDEEIERAEERHKIWLADQAQFAAEAARVNTAKARAVQHAMAQPYQTSLLPAEPMDPRDAALISWCQKTVREPVLTDTIEAADAWGANCGPMSLAAALGLKHVEPTRAIIHPFRGFMSPTDMLDALALAAKAGWIESFRNIRSPAADPWPQFGLVRVQWLGPWMDLADPRAAYRNTHWIGVCRSTRMRFPDGTAEQTTHLPGEQVMVYDATPNRWVPLWAWEQWCPTLWPKRATGWAPVTRIDVTLRTGPKGQEP